MTTWSPSASLQIKSLATKYTTVKWPITFYFAERVKLTIIKQTQKGKKMTNWRSNLSSELTKRGRLMNSWFVWHSEIIFKSLLCGTYCCPRNTPYTVEDMSQQASTWGPSKFNLYSKSWIREKWRWWEHKKINEAFTIKQTKYFLNVSVVLFSKKLEGIQIEIPRSLFLKFVSWNSIRSWICHCFQMRKSE